MKIIIADTSHAATVAIILNEAANDLTSRFGKGNWSFHTSQEGVVLGMRGKTKVLLAFEGDLALGTLCLSTRKPWVIDTSYFSFVRRPVYLTGMAVRPLAQGKQVGRALVEEAKRLCVEWPGDSLRLDAYDAPAGAGGFYVKCGFEERGRIVYRSVPHIYYQWLA